MKFFVPALLVAAAISHHSIACTTDDDCNLNGWTASDCGQLDLRPATRYTGYNRTAEGISSWGAKIIHDPFDSKTFHLFMAEFVNGCGLNYWSPYSRVIRSTSSTGPEGPYHFDGEVVGTFAHNPTVVYSEADQLYILIHIGCPVTVVPEGCSSTAPFSCGPGNTYAGDSGISAWSSTDLRNWTSHGQVMPGNANGTWDSDTTNPSPFPLWSANDHTDQMLMAYRGCIWNCANGLEHIGIAVASNFTGPYTRAHGQPIITENTEDPFLWRDKRGNFHMLVHSLDSGDGLGHGPNVGYHAYARNWDGEWTYNNNTLAYSTYVSFTDGTATNYSRRERPQLFFSEDGNQTPLFIANGVQEVDSPQSYTIVQPIGDGAKEYIKSLGF
ncbi:conserved hypothetical protein [Talaromyces stipitatus ATCC 10500]|uniref:Glycosyl hydrolase family 43 protein n=1 Tax=Talaromyces stipitatus (strain ATCC 10500 / CBS 375.48 / QM 6759 / NRRL 1006) TaxID=441959 RepID=B8MNY6_TALSN|nr:uncharacterized protein TSTA_104410 [Talaromyces stipitatus ATCC 10500]EED14225.1 conserved hypothetical protein [Talaromyces stipitatus ATCC 10500]